MTKKFKINLHDAHRQSGFTMYRVAKTTGMSHNTIQKYVGNGDVITGRLDGNVLQLAHFYDVDWRDPAIIEVIEVDDET